MNPIKNNLQFNFQSISSRRNQRGDLLEMFCNQINPPRREYGIKEIKLVGMAKLLKGIDLYPFYKECEKASNFSKYFWWKLKTLNNF